MKTRTSTVTRLGLAALGLSLIVPVLPAAAFDRVSETGQRAVQDLITRRANNGSRVVFQSTQRRNTGNEVLLTGKGYTSRGNMGRGRGNNAARDFTYSVRVSRNGDSARSISVRFTNGETLTNNGTWYRDREDDRNRNDRNDRANILKPEPGFNDTDGNVTFEGRSDSRTVTVTVLDRGNGNNNRVVTTRRVNVGSNGRWSTNIRLNEGTYRARVESGNGAGRNDDTVNFTVGDGNGNGNGNDDTRANFDRPENNFVDRDGEIRFSGDSEGSQVELRIYRGSREVLNRRIDVRDDRWDVTLRLDDGDYRATIRTLNGRGTASVRFRVDRE